MKIAVTSSGGSLDAEVDPRFGRCEHFVFVETDDMSFEAAANPSVSLPGGAGIQSTRFVADKGAKAVLTGNCGPNAYQTLQAAEIEVYVGFAGTVREAVEDFKAGKATSAGGATVGSKFGLQAEGPSELDALKEQARVLEEQLRQTKEKIEERGKEE